MDIMAKRIVILFIAMFLIPALFIYAQPEKIIINNNAVYMGKQRAPVKFPHGNHMAGLSCTDCHHKYGNGKNVIDESELIDGNRNIKCAYCHTSKSSLMSAYHRQCIGCHSKTRKEGKASGPVLCGKCHPWK